MYNTIKIKRRLASSPLTTPVTLEGGELGYNEKNDTLYYGSEAGTIAIAGSGAFVDLVTSQTIGGDKTFTGVTTLEDTIFASGVTIDVNANRITDVGAPVAGSDAATKTYVDTASANFVRLTSDQDVYGVKTWYNNANFKSNVTIDGDLTVLGSATKLETTTSVTSSFEITNTGSSLALKVTQTGNTDVAAFFDDANTALIIKNGGNVGINTTTPGERLTVSGNISASGNVFVRGDLYVQGNEIYLGDGDTDNVTITPFTPPGANDAANLTITGTQGLNNASAEGSDINLLGGDSFVDGGDNRVGSGGEVVVQGGTGATGGNVEVRGGLSDAISTDTTSGGGSVLVRGGSSSYGPGGNVDILAGNGVGGTYDKAGVLNIGVALDGVITQTVTVSGNGATLFPGAIKSKTGSQVLEGFILDGGEF